MKLLEGKRGLVFGIANDHSLGWHIARAAALQGARVGLNYHDDRLLRRVRPLADQIQAAFLAPCDVADEAALDAFFARAADVFDGQLDFVVHSVAFADRADLLGRFVDTTRAGHALALDVSAYSFTAIARRAAPLMLGGGSLLTLTYYGAEKAMPGYNVMGVAKAALEASVRYLAADLGPASIRVNGISAGPIRTLAAAGIPGFRDMLKATADKAPLRRNVTGGEVGDAAAFLLSDLSSAVTGEILHVDAGYHAVGV
ncbi:MAG: enoyl-ACP reductase [Myxococcales bacterium]|nr:enoyl-ACP reductase [Myxococcales bacterium]